MAAAAWVEYENLRPGLQPEPGDEQDCRVRVEADGQGFSTSFHAKRADAKQEAMDLLAAQGQTDDDKPETWDDSIEWVPAPAHQGIPVDAVAGLAEAIGAL